MSLFRNTFHVLVTRNRFRVRHLESNREADFDANPPFTTARLLIGEFGVAEALLKRALREMLKSNFFSVGPRVLMQPLEMLEGGLSEIEHRILKELAIGAGAMKSEVWVGPRLEDAEIMAKLK